MNTVQADWNNCARYLKFNDNYDDHNCEADDDELLDDTTVSESREEETKSEGVEGQTQGADQIQLGSKENEAIVVDVEEGDSEEVKEQKQRMTVLEQQAKEVTYQNLKIVVEHNFPSYPEPSEEEFQRARQRIFGRK